MKTFLQLLQKSPMGLYDSDTGKSLKAYKAVDLTYLCPGSKQFIVKYAKAKRGLIAQINDLYEPGNDLGVQVHYFLNETSAKKLSQDKVFEIRANIAGCDPYTLAVEIYLNTQAPILT